ncbi:hemin-degrading factor [Enterobacterales bacterium CwR94]|nr:hemin-degrading factor [Enterobacterales bacterium CwR94]
MRTTYQDYLTAKAAHPKKYARDLAALMGISEAALLLVRCEADAKSLKADFPALLQGLEAVGETKSIVRNEYAVHEQIGVYSNLHLGEHAGLVLNPRALDQRFFPQQWNAVFALSEAHEKGDRHSIQIFDHQGDAVLKIYVTANTDMTAWQALIAHFIQPTPAALVLTEKATEAAVTEVEPAQIDSEWRAMTDVHQFFRLLKRHNLTRQQAFRAVGQDLAQRVDNTALDKLLKLAQADGNEIMVFISNRGCTQIFTGQVQKLMPMENWINIFNPAFTLHLMADKIAESWITRKPTANGMVTSLELFAADGTQIAQLYGQRTEGEQEQTRWREQLAAVGSEGVAA